MTPSLEVEKKRVRSELRTRWRALSPEALSALSRAITERVLGDSAWAAAKAVLLYCAMPGEIETEGLAREAFESGKSVCVPRTLWEAGELRPVRLRTWEEAGAGPRRPDRAAVPVPAVDAPEVVASTIDLVIVPGLGFDALGNRLGRGAGFYDRFLLEHALGAKAIGLAPERMILDHVPAGAMDARVGAIATESRLIRARAE